MRLGLAVPPCLAADAASWVVTSFELTGESDAEPRRPGDVPADAKAPAAASRCWLAGSRPAADAWTPPPGGRTAGRHVRGLLHPARTGPRSPPIAAGACRP